MKSVVGIVAVCLGLVVPRPACAVNLEVTVHPHVRRVVFGDPIYLEVRIVNRDAIAVTWPAPSAARGTLLFRPSEGDRRDSTLFAAPTVVEAGPPSAAEVRFEPNQPVSYYYYLFLPAWSASDESLWTEGRMSHSIELPCIYRVADQSLGWTRGVRIDIQPRDPDQLRMLERFAALAASGSPASPALGEFGLTAFRHLSQEQTQRFAASIKQGELADLLRLASRLHDIEAAPADRRDILSRELAEWISNQPDVMRQTLARKLHGAALAHHLSATATMLQPLMGGNGL